MVKLIGIGNTLFLVFLATMVFSDVVQGTLVLCQKPSETLPGSCTGNKTCLDACIKEFDDGHRVGGACDVAFSFDEVEFNDCVKEVTESSIIGVHVTSVADCSGSIVTRVTTEKCQKVFEEAVDVCRSKTTSKIRDQCTCVYRCG